MPAASPVDSARRARPSVRILAVCLPLLLLAGADLGLRAAGLAPPDHPLLFFARTHRERFSPFVDIGRGFVAIKPDWVSHGGAVRGDVGLRAGRLFLYPGFRPTWLAVPKPADTIRIFALGGSSTFGQRVGQLEAFPALLAEALEAVLPAQKVEVANLGCPGWGSDRLANLLPALLELEPDLLVVYAGHNELLMGHEAVMSELGPADRLRAHLLEGSVLFRWLNFGIAAVLHGEETGILEEEVAALRAGHAMTFEPAYIAPEERSLPPDAFFERAEAAYAANLRALGAAAEDAGVPIVFVLPVANLRSPPAVSAHAAGFDAELPFGEAFEAAARGLRQGDARQVLLSAERAAGLSPRHAAARYLYAEALLAAGREREAAERFSQARDLDLRTHRITSGLEAAFLEVMDESGLPWVDPRPVFHARLDPAVASRLFLDHVHPTRLGHRRLAALLLPAVQQALGSPSAGLK